MAVAAAAQSLRPTVAAGDGQACRFRSQPRTARGDEPADVGSGVHVLDGRRASSEEGGAVGTRIIGNSRVRTDGAEMDA